MKYKLLILLGMILPAFGDEKPPQTVSLVGKSKAALTNLDYMWSRPVSGCDILNYHLFDYTIRHPERVKFTDDSEVASVEGFVDFLGSVPVT